MSQRRVRRLDGLLILVGLAIVVAVGMGAVKPGRPVLTVWSCGSNYESLSDFSALFGQRHGCRVRYTAAPVQYLLELAISTPSPPDVIVGRGGPGWEALRQRGKLARGPVFFALDPYVIITPLGNPAGVKSLEDLGRDGVRVVSAPWAMRPRGKCPAHLVYCVSDKFFPGLVERWANNTARPIKCGRRLAEPVIAGTADATIVPRCMTSWPSIAGKVQVVPIAIEHLLSLKQCRATIPQCCGILRGARRPGLAATFVDELISEQSEEFIARHGYIPVRAPQAKPFKPLLQVFKPKDMAGWQAHMAKGLLADGAYMAALRRAAQVISLFGPNHYEARSRYLAAEALLAAGRQADARRQLQRLVDEFPRPGKLEWESSVLHVGKPVPGIEKIPEAEWVRRGRQALSKRTADPEPAPEQQQWLEAFEMRHRPVREGDPAKNGTRNLEVGKDLLQAGHPVGASRDLLKVITINYPSKHMDEARFWVGVATYLRGHTRQAIAGWERLATEGQGDWAHRARQAIARADQTREAPAPPERLASPPMPKWQMAYATNLERGMSYGMVLWHHEMPLYCLKEMLKIATGIYGKPGKLGAMAKFRAGVCCMALGKPKGAMQQWSACVAKWPNSPWASKAGAALAGLPPQIRAARGTQKPDPAWAAELAEVPMGGWLKRFRVAEQMFKAGVFEEDQALLEYWKAMTVTDPSQDKNRKLRPLAEFRAGQCCRRVHREEAAREHFTNVVERFPQSRAAQMARQALRQEAH